MRVARALAISLAAAYLAARLPFWVYWTGEALPAWRVIFPFTLAGALAVLLPGHAAARQRGASRGQAFHCATAPLISAILKEPSHG